MAALLGGRNARANTPNVPLPTLTLNIQTSIQGRARPIGCGTGVHAGNLIDIQDFTPVLVADNSSSPSGGAGKGGLFRTNTVSAQPTYAWNYYATVVISLGEGPITSVNRFTGDGITLGTYPSPSAGGTVFTGTQTQTAWSYMSVMHADHALAYRGEAYIGFSPMYLGTNSAVPSFQFEVTWDVHGAGSDFPLDANPRDWLTAFLTNTQWGIPGFPSSLLADLSSYAAYCQALGLVISITLTDQTEASQHINDVMQATNSEIVWSNGLLHIVPYGDSAVTAHGATFTPNDTPVYDLLVDDFLPLQGGSASTAGDTPIAITRKSAQDLYNNVRIEYLDRTNTYIAAEVDHKDEAAITMTRERPTDVRAMHMFALASAASMSAALQLTRERVGTIYYFTLPRSFILLDPMDLVSLPLDEYGLSDAPQVVRIKEIQENADYTLSFTAEDFDGTATAPLYARQGISHGVPDFNADPGGINTPILFEPPFNVAGEQLAILCAVSGANSALWGGADVYVSYDNTNYILVDQIKGASRMGVTTATLPSVTAAGTPPTIDNTNALHVDLTESLGSLNNASAADMTNGNTACWLADTGEIVAFQNAALTGANAYSLSPLQRGAFGTPISSHPSGTAFVRIDGTVFNIPYDKSRIGATIYVKFVSFNVYGGGQRTIDSAVAYSYTIQGAALNSQYHYTPESASIVSTDHVLFVSSTGAQKKAPMTAIETLLAGEGALATGLAAASAAITAANATIASNATTAHAEAQAAQTLANNLFSQAETDIGAVNTAISTETSQRKTGDTQTAVKIDNVVTAAPNTDWTDFNDFFNTIRIGAASTIGTRAQNTAQIAYAGVQTLQATILQNGLAFASLSTVVSATLGDIQAAVANESTARAAGDTANANSISSVQAQTSSNTAAISVLQSTTSNPSGTFAAIETNLFAGYNNGDDFSALADFFNVIRSGQIDQPAKLAANQALAGVQSNSSSLADAKQSIASISSTVAARFGDAFAAIYTNATAIANAQESIASLISTVATQGSSITSNATAISNTQGDIASLSTTITTQGASITTLQATQTTQSGQLATISTTLTTHGSSISSIAAAQSTDEGNIATLQSTVSSQGASISSNATAISNLGGSVANLTTTLFSSDVGGTSRITIAASAAAGAQSAANSAQSTANSANSLAGTANNTANAAYGAVSARYTIKLDAGGNIVGMSLIAGGGDTSRVAFLADNFTISSPSHPDLVAFGLLNLNGTPELAINGNKVGDLSLLNNSIGNNAVSNSASSSGNASAAYGSGNASINVRAGARILVLCFYSGGDFGVQGGLLLPTINGTQGTGFAMPYTTNGPNTAYFACSGAVTYTASAAGTQTARCASNLNGLSSNATVYIQELSK